MILLSTRETTENWGIGGGAWKRMAFHDDLSINSIPKTVAEKMEGALQQQHRAHRGERSSHIGGNKQFYTI